MLHRWAVWCHSFAVGGHLVNAGRSSLTKVSLMGGLVQEISVGIAVGSGSMSFGGAISTSAVV